CVGSFSDPESCEFHRILFDHWPDYECGTCTRVFGSASARNQHMSAVDHWPYECDYCTCVFLHRSDWLDHMDDCDEKPSYYCSDCDRYFLNENSLKQHRNSRTHRGANVPCPFCKRGFTSPSGVAHHLETASCPKAPRVNRDEIYRIIRERDPNGKFTKKLLTWTETTPSPSWNPGYAWNGSEYECYICHRGFTTARGLEQHINSPVHAQKRYHCPNKRCGVDFVSLAAMFNHLESESCGAMRFETVTKTVKKLFDSNRLLC
ncbi:hypothetical protein K490DRAFT_31561, partial [Saccharata proteae CBS 121410]